MPEGPCRLCGRTAELVDSHIIPKFFFKKMKRSEDYLLLVSKEQPRAKRSLTGIYGQFLCLLCENSFSQVDDYASTFFPSVSQQPIALMGGKPFRKVLEFDYLRLKKFFISLLWRASVSSRPEYNKITLAQYDDTLRLSLLGLINTASIPLEICGEQYLPSKKIIGAEQGFLSPWKGRVDDIPSFTFIFGGFKFVCFLGDEPTPIIKSICLKDGRSWHLPLTNFDSSNTMQALIKIAKE
jgi:hypothetical protein